MTRFHHLRALVAGWRGDRRPALTFYAGRTRVGTTSYAELCGRVEAVYGYLWESLGVRPGDRIAVLSPNRLEVPVVMLAIMAIGAVVVPLNPTAPPDDWAYILAHARARGCFATRDLAAKLALDAPAFVHGIDELGRGAAPPLESDARSPAVILYTSGTTGRPKGVVLAQDGILANAWSLAENFALRATTQLAVLPLYHAHALGFGLMTALTTGGHLVFSDRFDPFAWPELVRAHDVAIASVVPTLLPTLLQAGLTAARVPSLRAILVSSAPLSIELAREVARRSAIRLVHGWGLSEYTNFACCTSPDEDPLYDVDVPSVGSPLVGTEVRVVDAGGRELPARARGELCVRGHSTMQSYLDDPEATRQAIDANGWLHTGDEGFWIPRGDKRTLFVTGRLKEIIIRGGEKHSPIALERILAAAVPELASDGSRSSASRTRSTAKRSARTSRPRRRPTRPARGSRRPSRR